MVMLSTTNVDKPQSDIESRIKLIVKLGYPTALVQVAKFVDKQKLFDIETVFIMGYDTIVRFFDHKYYSDIANELDGFFKRSKIVMFHRESKSLRLEEKYKESVEIYQELDFGYPVSSTIVRNLLKDPMQRNEQSLKKYIPSAVLAEILRLDLYKGN
jgi:nicotinic acid mononucleotide adenylyltransferase